MYSVDCCPKGLVIGKQGENEAERIVIDFSAWASEHGAGTISARLRRPKDSAAYPVVLTAEGTTATWAVSATDTQYAGAGSLQLVYIVGDVVAKSVIWPVRVLPSLEEGEAPEPYESWLDTLEGLAADTQENARDAAASAADAAQSAQNAAESAASITGLTAVAETLPEGSEASASFDSTTDTLTLGIPRGDTGATGPAGPAGPKGDTGADGFSPSASVTKQDGNITITVTDKDGTTSETLEVDDALDETSENPVQNAAIVEAMRSMLPVDTASGAIASFPDGADNVPVKSLVVQIEPIQEGSGDPSPDNVRPISGHTGVKVEKKGKNLLQMKLYDGGTYNPAVGAVWTLTESASQFTNPSEGVYEWTPTASWQQRVLLAEVDKSLSYHLKLKYSSTGTAGRTIGYLDENYTVLTKDNTTDAASTFNSNLVIPSGAKYLYIVLTNRSNASVVITVTEPQLELGSTATDYEPYQGETISQEFVDDQGNQLTVYGGELDVVSGKLTVDRAMVDLGALTWAKSATANRFMAPFPQAERFTALYTKPDVARLVCSNYATVGGEAGYLGTNDYGISGSYWNDTNYLQINDLEKYSDMDAAAFKTAMNGVQLVYELAEPFEYTLTPQEVKTYLGQNNIWNDCGDTEVTYRADIQEFIEKKVNA